MDVSRTMLEEILDVLDSVCTLHDDDDYGSCKVCGFVFPCWTRRLAEDGIVLVQHALLPER